MTSLLIDKINRRLRRAFISLSSTPRKGSHPFISGDTFREWADFVYENGSKCKAEDIKEGSIVFLSGECLDEFFNKIHPNINCCYKLITHNSDRGIGEKEISYIDHKVIRWFAQNALVIHPKITPIPIGLESLSYSNAGRLSLFKNLAYPRNYKKDILVNFNVLTNPKERKDCLEKMRKNKLANIVEKKISQRDYIKLLKSSLAVASPPGNGEDCHRTWEAILFGTIPIVKRSAFVEHFASLGLPLWIVEDYSEITSASEKELRKKCEVLLARSIGISKNLLAYHYWQGIIRAPENNRDTAIVCIATGEKYLSHYEKYFKESQERFAFEQCLPLIVISDNIEKSTKHPSWQKLLMFKSPILKNFNRVILLDGDIYIKDHSENPINLTPSNHWGLVKNNTFELPSYAKTDPTLYNNCPQINRPTFVLNCGFFIVNRETHSKIMEYVFNDYTEQICYEQGPLSYYLITEFEGTILPWKFNSIVPAYMEKFGYSMSSVISLYDQSNFIHFAGNSGKKMIRLFPFFNKYPILLDISKKTSILWMLDGLTLFLKKVKNI